jgi:hypothetical protein
MTPEQAIADALAGLPPEQSAPLHHPPERQRAATEAPALQRLSQTDRQAWALDHLRTAGPLSPQGYARAVAVSVDTALRDLRALMAQGLVRAEGTTKDRRYRLCVDEAERPFAACGAFEAATDGDSPHAANGQQL